MQLGYIIISNEVMLEGKRIGYIYREKPDSRADSGWRIFSGAESQDYADNAKNFAMYDASMLVEIEPSLNKYIDRNYPIALERDSETGEFVEIHDLD